RFYDVTDGAIYIGHEDVRNLDLVSLRKLFGIVPQKTELFSGSIIDNIRWGKPDATLEEVIEVCKVVQAHDFVSGFKDGYDTIIGEKGSSLSGGQKQRIAIARAIIGRPRYLIFDDSTSALDLSTEARLYQAMSAFLKDTTIILIAQRVVSAKRANRIAILDNGNLVACDTHANLLKTNAIYQDIYYSQLKDEG
ncbi:MAG TPA: ATP-binding cassette domain-containing protein, partial [Bacilli bacterium]|nr:ATP-binding cassette domain-containing protein [Bacilli bacterium]